MKPDIHPEYVVATVTCSCGNTFETRSTQSVPVNGRSVALPSSRRWAAAASASGNVRSTTGVS